MSNQEGPAVSINYSCYGCKHVKSERFDVQGDSGYDKTCLLTGKDTGESYSWKTPDWCPLHPNIKI